MPAHDVPQPGFDRMVPLLGHPLVVGVKPGQADLVPRTAMAWARGAGVSALYFAYVDPTRFVRVEHPDGTVSHDAVDPDGADEAWRDRQHELVAWLEEILADARVPWHFRYLAGRPDRTLTHLARAVDAAGFVVGAREPGAGARMRGAPRGLGRRAPQPAPAPSRAGRPRARRGLERILGSLRSRRDRSGIEKHPAPAPS